MGAQVANRMRQESVLDACAVRGCLRHMRLQRLRYCLQFLFKSHFLSVADAKQCKVTVNPKCKEMVSGKEVLLKQRKVGDAGGSTNAITATGG